MDVDESLTTLGVVKPPKKLRVAKNVKVEAEKAKIEMWKALVSLLKSSPQVAPSNDDNVANPVHAPTLVERRVNLIGKLVADNLLECDPKDWSMLRKRIFDMFFEYEQQKSLSMQASALKPPTSRVFGFQNDPNIYSQRSYLQFSKLIKQSCIALWLFFTQQYNF